MSFLDILYLTVENKNTPNSTTEHLVYLYCFEPKGYTNENTQGFATSQLTTAQDFQNPVFPHNKYKNGKRAEVGPNIAENQALAGIQMRRFTKSSQCPCLNASIDTG